MKKKPSKPFLLKPRLSVYGLKPEQVHKTRKNYNRLKDKKELRENLKIVLNNKTD